MKTTGISSNKGLPVREIDEDILPPKCINYNVNLNTDTIILLFDEPILVESLVPTSISLVSSITGQFVSLVGIESIELVDRVYVEINLVLEDLVKVKICLLQYFSSLSSSSCTALIALCSRHIGGNDS